MLRHFVILLAGAALVAGCGQARTSTPGAEGPDGLFKPASEFHVSTRDYRVDPPDELIIRAPNITELDGQRQTVRSDGKISLNLLDEVYVAGMTPAQINAHLRELASRYYVDPDIKVEVIANSKFYYVFGPGAVAPARYPYTGRDSVLTALAEAGFRETAWPRQVRLSRPPRNEGEQPATAVIDFSRIFQYGDLSQNYLIEEGDIIEVPETGLATFNRNLTQILGPVTGASTVVHTGQSMQRN